MPALASPYNGKLNPRFSWGWGSSIYTVTRSAAERWHGHLWSLGDVCKHSVLSHDRRVTRCAEHLVGRHKRLGGKVVSVCKAVGADLVSICKQSKTESPAWFLALVFAICLIFFFFFKRVRGCDEYHTLWPRERIRNRITWNMLFKAGRPWGPLRDL